MTAPVPCKPVPILMYHAVEDQPRPPRYKHFYVTAREFALQMRMLKAAGYTALTFAGLADAMAGRTPLPHRPVLLTFDDGYTNLLTNVHPLLAALDFPYTVFLVADKVGKTNDWVVAEGYAPTPLLDWPDILALQSAGKVEFGGHTLSHPRLTALNADDARREIGHSKDVLEQKLGMAVPTFCYPYGAVNTAAIDIVRESGYNQAVTTRTGRVRAGDDPFCLPRLSVMHVPPLSVTYGIGPLNFWWRVLLWKDTRP